MARTLALRVYGSAHGGKKEDVAESLKSTGGLPGENADSQGRGE